MPAPDEWVIPDIRSGVPTPARLYDYCLGGKDNFAVDRTTALAALERLPGALDEARANRLFLYRVVRFLAQEAGVTQFLDMGSGLPTQANVHQVAQRFRPGAHVVYVDNDPIVLSHGQALLADNETTTVISADITKTDDILHNPDTRQLIDFDRPVAVLYLSVAHFIVDDAAVRQMMSAVVDCLAPGSYVALSQTVGADRRAAAQADDVAAGLGMAWRSRTRDEVVELLSDLDAVPPGFVNVDDWRPDPFQPSLDAVDEPLRPFLGASAYDKRFIEFGGVGRKA